MKNNLFSTLVVNKNFFKKSLLALLVCFLATNVFAQTKVYDFSDDSALDEWTFSFDNPKGGEGKWEISSSLQGISSIDGAFLGLSFLNNSQITITMTSNDSFEKITHISYDVAATDNSKPDFTLNIVDDDGNVVQNIYSNKATKADFNSGGTKKWGKSDEEFDAVSGHVQIVLFASSSGKYAAIDNIAVTSGGDTPGEDPQDEGEPVVQSFSFPNMVSGTDVYDEANLAMKAKIKFGSDRTNIKPTFKGKNISDNWDPASANFEENETQEFTFTYTKSGKVKNYSVTILEAEKEPEPSGDEEWLIKGTSQQEATGPAAGSVETNLSKKDEVKLDKKKYFGLILENGYVLQENDVFVINISTAADLGKCMLFADKDGQELLYDEGVEYTTDAPSATGEKAIVLPAAVEGKSAIYLWREDGATQWNPRFNYIGIKRDGIEIVTIAVTGVSLDQPSISIEEGKTATLNATVEPSNATDKSVSWSSSDGDVAKVDNNGKVTAVAAGTATITVTTNDGGFTASCEVTVTKKPDTPEPPTPSGDAIFEWVMAGENNINEDATDLSSNYGNLIVGTSIQARLFKENPIEYNAKGYKLGNNDVCFEIQGTSDFQIGDVVTIAGVCGGDGERSFAIAPVSTEDAKADTALTNAIDDKTNTNNFIATITEKQVGQKIRIFRLAGKTMYLSAIKVTRGGETPPPSGDVPVTGVKLDKSEQEVKLEVGGSITLNATVEPSNATDKSVSWFSSNEGVAKVDNNGKVTAVADGTATITVSTKDGGFTASCEVTVTKEETPDIPETDLTLHVPGVYEAKASEGGYDTKMSEVKDRLYEVYYTERTDKDNYPTFSTTPVPEGKTSGISGSTSESENSGRPGDTWFKGTIASNSECKKASSIDEFVFEEKNIREHRLGAGDKYQFHVKGFDQFSLWGMDKKIDPSKNIYEVFVVKIDGKERPTDKSLYNKDNYTVRRYDMTSGEHLIEITANVTGSNVCYMGAFSLREAKEPSIKYFKGNDSTQVVLQTTDIKPIRYTTKYNDIDGAEIKLEFDRTASATGIELTTLEGGITDTIVLSGKAMCPVGEYHYSIVSYLYGKETSRVNGTFSVISQIVSVSEINVTADQGEEMDPINFYYYALSPEDVQVNWPNGEPGGTVKGHGTDGTGYNYVIDGKPENVGQFPFEISVLGADTVIKGLITVESSELGPNPVLYLFKNTYENDGVFEHLKKNWSPKPKKALDQLREPEEYAKYKLVVISEDADANNEEVLALARGGAAIPILNLNGFSYAEGRLEWGDPSNGSVDTVTNNGCKIYIERDDHPIFRSFKGRDSIQVFSELVAKKGVMPIDVTLQGTQCLATAYTRNIMDYYKDGEKQTVIHEIPARMRGEQKYICFPISRATSAKLTPDGKNLLDAILAYLMDPTASPVFNPDLQIHRFSLQGHDGIIDQTENTITIEITDREFMALDSLRAVKPSITLAESKYVHVTPSPDKEQDFRFSFYMPIVYTVSDYINRLSYSVSVRVKSTQGIEDVYAPGDWVNVFDIYGRKVATTNEDIYSMSLPHGMYIVVTESGETLKIMR